MGTDEVGRGVLLESTQLRGQSVDERSKFAVCLYRTV
jgi:hypothetical protein